MADKSAEDGKVCAILTYLLVGIIWYFADDKMKKNKFARFHAQQGIVLLIIGVAFWIVSGIMMMPFRFIPFLGAVVAMLFSLLNLVILVLCIIGIIHAAQGNEKELPIVGKYGEKLKI